MAMLTPGLSLPPHLLAEAFPFHFVFNHDFQIIQAGTVLQRVIPDIVGSTINQCFEVKRPSCQLDFNTINKYSRSVFMLQSLQCEMIMKGQMVYLKEQKLIFFLGSPWVTEIEQLNQLGIKLKDFAVHDSIADFLFLLQTKDKLTEELLEQRHQLRTVLFEKEKTTAIAQAQADELKQALENLQQAQIQLIQTEKMSSLGQMVAGIAHEINNPINFIYGNLSHVSNYTQELLNLVDLYQVHSPQTVPAITNYKEDIELDFLRQDLPNLISSMKMGTERIKAIVLSLRSFSRLDEADLKEVNLHEGIDDTLLILNHKLKQEIKVVKKYTDLPPVYCYPAQLNQVFMNVISNAADALVESQNSFKQIVIETSRVDRNYVCISIEDNGSGMDSEVQQKIFNPFFTTKPIGKGTGLGLSISHQIITKHQGEINVISQLGKGTKFLIKIPI